MKEPSSRSLAHAIAELQAGVSQCDKDRTHLYSEFKAGRIKATEYQNKVRHLNDSIKSANEVIEYLLEL